MSAPTRVPFKVTEMLRKHSANKTAPTAGWLRTNSNTVERLTLSHDHADLLDLAQASPQQVPADERDLAEWLAVVTGTSLDLDALRAPNPHLHARPRIGDIERGADGLHYSDVGNAERLVRLHGDHLRYIATWQRWHAFDGQRWRVDHDRVSVTELTKDIARHLWRAVPDITDLALRDRHLKHARKSEQVSAIRAAVELARTTPGIAIDHEALDTDPMLLNVENGTLDLRTFELREHDPDDLITKLAPVRHDPEASAPMFEQFLTTILPDADLRAYVQRLVGYSLTGSVDEQIIVLAIGSGANGKSTLLTIIRRMLGDYATVAARDLLIVQAHEPHPTSTAALAGIRFATAIETEQGSRLAEAKVKELTGGDRLTARRMREDFWQFDPTHTLWLAANHRPTIEGTDHAIWRRIRVIPFEVRIPDAEIDLTLAERIIDTELPGVLRWALDGCREWQTDGLGTPEAVTGATDAYRAEQDLVTRFLTDAGLDLVPGHTGLRIVSSDLTEAHRRWCDTEGLHHESQWRATTRALQERGAVRTKSGSHRLWTGIGLP